MIKKNIYVLFILTLLFFTVSSIAFAVDTSIASFVNNLMSNESWSSSQLLSNDEIKYTNDPEYISSPSCGYNKPAVVISDFNNVAFLQKNFGESKDIKIVFKAVTIPSNDTTNNPLVAGLRNNNATKDLAFTGETATVDATFKKTIGDPSWELYINGSQLNSSKNWALNSFIIDNVEYSIYDSEYSNVKICTASAASSSDYGAAKYSRKETYQIFDHEAEYHVEISSDQYDVQKSIPTSEEIKTNGWIDNADYHIKARTTTYNASVNGVKLTASISYGWGKYETVDDERKWVSSGTKTETVTETMNYSTESKIYYDVPISDTAILIGGYVNASDDKGNYGIGECVIPASNIMGSGPSAINFKENFVSIDKEYNFTGSVGSNYTSQSSAKAAASEKAKSLIEEKKHEIILALIRSFQGDQDAINYKFCGLTVNKDGISRNT